ncbi:hypothetical protein PR048_032311 [Dryococelus australis]|uniref:Uncharacterized protein n=1 Tax=Dryococelus australis TaxID=614101 RepID=A0ABQ9G1V1_9NEOP|nr:hypothetical protein PR048_032311 [Dryococelus australis]
MSFTETNRSTANGWRLLDGQRQHPSITELRQGDGLCVCSRLHGPKAGIRSILPHFDCTLMSKTVLSTFSPLPFSGHSLRFMPLHGILPVFSVKPALLANLRYSDFVLLKPLPEYPIVVPSDRRRAAGEVTSVREVCDCEYQAVKDAAGSATVAERLTRSPPTKTNRVQSPAGSPDFFKWESCRMMPLVGGSSRGSPVSTAPSFRRCSIFTSNTLIGSQDLGVKSRPNLFTHSFTCSDSYTGIRNTRPRFGDIGSNIDPGIIAPDLGVSGPEKRPEIIFASRNRAERCRWSGGFSRGFPFSLRPFILAPLHTHLDHRYRLPRPCRLRAAQISSLHFTYHQGELGSIPGRATPDFCKWESCRTMPLVRRVFSVISSFLSLCLPALLHSHLTSPSSALKTSYRFNGLITPSNLRSCERFENSREARLPSAGLALTHRLSVNTFPQTQNVVLYCYALLPGAMAVDPPHPSPPPG